MIYIKNTTTKQEIWIPRNEVDINVIPTPKTYEEGYKEGQKDGKEEGIDFQKDQLLNLYVTENGIYEREDGYGKVTVDIPNEGECKLENLGMITYTSNGVYTLTPSEGYDGISEVKVDVWVPKEANLQRKTVELTDKVVLYVKPDNGYDGLKSVNINAVPLAQNEYNKGYEDGQNNFFLEDRVERYIKNGGYYIYPSEGFDGLSRVEVLVDVPQEGGSCNLEDKIIAPQINEVDGYGYLYIRPNEGYDGMKEVALQTDNLKREWRNEGYEEGYEEGKSQGGGGGEEYNILDFNLNPDILYYEQKFAANEGVSGWQEVIVRTGDAYEAKKEEGRNEIRNSLTTLNVTENGIYDAYEIVTYEVNVLDAKRVDYIFVNSGEEKNYLRILFSTFSNKEVQLEKQTLGRFGEYYLTYSGGGIRIEGLEEYDLGNLPYDANPIHINEVIITPTYFEVNGNRQDLPINLFELMGYDTWLEVGPFDNTIISVSKDDSIYLHLNRYNIGDTIDRRYMDFKKYTEEGWNRVEVKTNLNELRLTPTSVVKFGGITVDEGDTPIDGYMFGYDKIYYAINKVKTGNFKTNTTEEDIFFGAVYEIKDDAFKDWSGLKSITFDTVSLKLGKECFGGCTSLNKITIKQGYYWTDFNLDLDLDAFKDCPTNGTIYYTYTGDNINPDYIDQDFISKWLKVLPNGWNVVKI